MNFVELPDDIQEYIYSTKLNVIEKCNFHKVAKLKNIVKQPIETQKKLGIIYKVILRNEITTLSFQMTKFLCTYNNENPLDPTIREIALYFPEINEKEPISIYTILQNGNVRELEEYLENFTNSDLEIHKSNQEGRNLYEIIACQKVVIFKVLYKNEVIKNFVDFYRKPLVIWIAHAYNEELIEYLKNVCNFDCNFYFNFISIYFIKNNRIRAFMIKHFIFSRDEIEKAKKGCLENLFMDAYIDFDRIQV
jgi:hypothetical protein